MNAIEELNKACNMAEKSALGLLKSHVKGSTYTNENGTVVNRSEYDDSRKAAFHDRKANHHAIAARMSEHAADNAELDGDIATANHHYSRMDQHEMLVKRHSELAEHHRAKAAAQSGDHAAIASHNAKKAYKDVKDKAEELSGKAWAHIRPTESTATADKVAVATKAHQDAIAAHTSAKKMATRKSDKDGHQEYIDDHKRTLDRFAGKGPNPLTVRG